MESRSYSFDAFSFTGQVVALFIVGIGEYIVVWIGTDWHKEVLKGMERMEIERDAHRALIA